MKIHLLNFGSLRVEPDIMILGIPMEKIVSRYPVDEYGLMKIAMNSLLVEHENRLVLIDPGCGDFLPKRILDEYGLEIPVPPEALLREAGYNEEDVTDVIFTHLHFDHGTAAFKRIPGNIIKRYGNARYWMSEIHYQYSLKPLEFEKNSFFSFVFRYIDNVNWLEQWDANWMSFQAFSGHTRNMMVPLIPGKNYDLLFVSDLMPMALLADPGSFSYYDIDKELQLEEKKSLPGSLDNPTLVILYHEPADPFLLINGVEIRQLKYEEGVAMLREFIHPLVGH